MLASPDGPCVGDADLLAKGGGGGRGGAEVFVLKNSRVASMLPRILVSLLSSRSTAFLY